MLYNKTATHYSYTRNAYGVSKYDSEWTAFKCNVQPMDQAEWLDDATVYKMKKLYCDYSWIVVWDKISVDGVIYIVKSFQKRDGSRRKYFKVIISESEWN
jgi:hypothetical protein